MFNSLGLYDVYSAAWLLLILTFMVLRWWPLLASNGVPEDVNVAVFEDIDFNTSMGPLTLELSNFRLVNINPVMQQDAEQKFRNFGTNSSFKLPKQLVTLFTAKGFDGIAAQVDATVPEAGRSAVLDTCLKVLQTMLASLYTELLAENGVDLSQGISAQDGVFYDDAINAIGAVANYGSPFYIQLKSFEQIQSGGLQIAWAPGKALVYICFTLLIAGGPACSVFQQAVCGAA